MKVFRFNCGELYYVYSGNNQEEAREALMEEQSPKMVGGVEEIPEDQWDEKRISMWEDNDYTKTPYKVSIRDLMIGSEPQLLFTNDLID